MMKRVLGVLLSLVFAGALLGGGAWLWGRRPWRTAVEVNGRVITAGELELRARTLLEDAQRTGQFAVAREREREALQDFRKEAAKMWIVKEVLLGEAIARGTTVAPADEKEYLAQTAARLKSRKLTPDDFFREGPLPEEIKRRDFREGMLIGKFTKSEITEKVNVTTAEIDERVQNLKKIALMRRNGTPQVKTDRKTAINMLRAEKFQKGFRRLFRTLYMKSDVRCPLFPELEQVDGVSPARPEDGEAETVKEKGP